MNITFVNPNYLWLLAIIPALILTHFYGLKYSRKKALHFANFEALARVTGGFKLSMNLPLLLLRAFTLLFLVFSLSVPILWYEGRGGEFNFVVAIDSSGSMLANDFIPNRLEAAKQAALAFVDDVPVDSKVAVMSFSGTQFLKQVLTDDHSIITSAIEGISVEYSSGTAIGDAVIAGSNLFDSDEKGRVIVLLSDGQTNVGTVIEKAINYANERFVTVHTIGVGTEEGGKFQDLEALSTLNTDTLTKIAENTGGSFYRANNNEELLLAYSEIAKASNKKIPFHLAPLLIALTLLTLGAEWIVVNTKFRSVP